MSALPPEADMLIVGIDVCLVPRTDIGAAAIGKYDGGRAMCEAT